MMNYPLLISSLLTHAAKHHPDTPIVSRRHEEAGRKEAKLHRYTYLEMHARSKRLAHVLEGRLGVTQGDRVATLALNTYRHMELYFAVSGTGAILHTLNPRLFPETLTWIISHAQDTVVFFDACFSPLVERLASHCPTVKQWVCLVDEDSMPSLSSSPSLPPGVLLNYEALLKEASEEYAWPVFDETAASSLCYTSGTTGHPKGVLYSHRSTILHSFAAALPDSLNLSARDAVLPVVPLFHVNAWGIPYSAALVGCKLVLPGPSLDGESLYNLIEEEEVTVSAGVPTVWLGLLNYMSQNNKDGFQAMKRTVVGGAACPPSMLRAFVEGHGVDVLHAWGMTELSPLGTACTLKGKHLPLSSDERYALLNKQGRAIYGADFKIVAPSHPLSLSPSPPLLREVPWDGISQGELCVRGNWVVSKYYQGGGKAGKEEEAEEGCFYKDEEGLKWFLTGDVATISPDGYMNITDRSKDVIKSGGEWISSIELENVAMSHPQVAMAAVIAMPHPKWDERPLLIVVPKPAPPSSSSSSSTSSTATTNFPFSSSLASSPPLTKVSLLQHFEGKVAKWWIPDDVVLVESIPLGATGKVLKTELRKRFEGHT